MKKEMIISILVGLTFGLIITYGVYRARTSLSKTSNPDNLLTSPSPTSATNVPGMLVLVSPEDETVQSSNQVTVTGNAPANSYVVVFINNEQHITTTDETGNFSVAATLESGSNVIGVHAITDDGQTAMEERTVIVSNSTLDGENSASESAEKSN